MAGAEPGVVGNVMIAGFHGGQREFQQKMPHRFRHGIDVSGRAGNGLRHHATLAIEDAGRKIARFAHRGRECGADHDLRLLFHDGDQAVPHDLALNLRHGVGLVGHYAASRVSSM